MENGNYLKSMLSAKDEVSSKRFISLYSLLLFTIVLVCSLLGKPVPDSIIYALVSLILGSSVMTLAQNNSKSETLAKTDKPEEK